MINFLRIALAVICALPGAAILVRAQTPVEAPRSELSPELAALIAAQMRWSTWASVETAFGYKDNLLLSHIDEERSSFAEGTVRFMALRTGTPLDFSFYLWGSGTHFFAGKTINHEAQAWSQAEIGYHPREAWKFALDVRGYYDDRVFDVSDSDVQRLVAALRLTGVSIGPTMRWNFHPAWWLETEAVVKREKFDDGLNDRKIGEGTARLGWHRGDRLEISLGAIRRWRNFDELTLYSTVGRPLSGTHRKIAEREAELRLDIGWDRAAHWKTSTRATLSDYEDNGSGFFNTREKEITQELTWTRGPWLAEAEASAGRVNYDVQTVGFGIEPPPRLKDEFAAKLKIERKLAKQWTVFGSYSWERIRSNDTVASYIVNEGLLGVRWSWEK